MQQVAVGRGLDVGQAVEDLSEDHRDLAPSKMSPKAEVGAGSAEADVHIWTPANVEVERVGEHGRIAIGGEVEHADLVSSSDGLIPNVGVDHGGASHVRHGAREPDDLFDCGRGDRFEICCPNCALIWVLGQLPEAPADCVAGCLVSGHDQQDKETGEVTGGEFVVGDRGVHQQAGEVGAVATLLRLGDLLHEFG